RAGDRGALEAGCLPTLLPGGRPVADPAARVDAATAWGVGSLPETPGRDTDGIVAAAAAGELAGLVVGGVAGEDLADPAAFTAALRAARFVVSLELRATQATAHADVVLPVAAAAEKAGTFVTWEGRARPFPVVLRGNDRLPDSRVLAGIAEEMGHPLGFRTVDQVRDHLEALGGWDGARPALPAARGADAGADAGAGAGRGAPAARPLPGAQVADGVLELELATWKQLVDRGSLQDGDEAYLATMRPAVALLGTAAYDALGRPAAVTLAGPRGSTTLPAAHEPTLVDGVVWAPTRASGRGFLAELAGPGAVVRVAPAAADPVLPSGPTGGATAVTA
ncbi:molybdopterin-dependent oxidoreductase, partial [Nocardioides sp. ChNu-99]